MSNAECLGIGLELFKQGHLSAITLGFSLLTTSKIDALAGELRDEYINRLAAAIYECRVSGGSSDDEAMIATSASVRERLDAEAVIEVWMKRWQERSKPRKMSAKLRSRAQEWIANKKPVVTPYSVVIPHYWNP